MGLYDDRVLPRLVDLTCGSKGMERYRAKAIDGLAGEVVEIGFGTGLNVPLYPDAVTTVWAVEPSERSRELASDRVTARGVRVEHVGLDGQRLPLDDASCDAGLCTFTLCTVPDPMRALAELRRVIRPGGQLHVLERGDHLGAPDGNDFAAFEQRGAASWSSCRCDRNRERLRWFRGFRSVLCRRCAHR